MMRQKYIDEAVGVFFEFGVHPDGRVDVATQDGDKFCGLPKAVAREVIDAQAEFREKLYRILENE